MSELIKWQHPDPDQIIDRLRRSNQALWYVSKVCTDEIRPFYTLDQLIAWANQDIEEKGCDGWFHAARYPVTQFVKLCRLYQDFVVHKKNIKPVLLTPKLSGFEPLTGDSRLRALELVPGEHYLSAVITGPLEYASNPILEMKQLAQLIDVDYGTSFYLRINDGGSPCLEWYEIDVDTPLSVTGPNFVLQAENDICRYVQKQGAHFRFDRDWFCQSHPWSR